MTGKNDSIAGQKCCFFSLVSGQDYLDHLSVEEKRRYKDKSEFWGLVVHILRLFKSLKVATELQFTDIYISFVRVTHPKLLPG